MKTPSNRQGSFSRYGSVTIEMLAVGTAILIPFLLALSELVRLDRASRGLQFAAQKSCIKAAIAGNDDPSFRVIPVESQVRVAMRPEVVSLLKGERGASVTLRRCYWVATGTGYGNF